MGVDVSFYSWYAPCQELNVLTLSCPARRSSELLRRVFLPLRPNAGKDRALTRGGKQLVAGIEQCVSTVASDILQFEGKTAGDAEFGDSGGIEGDRKSIRLNSSH